MQLAAIKIDNFRSIQSATLDACGELNVLIGRNNSGKSNVLIALDRFFRFCARKAIANDGLQYLRVDTEVFERNKNLPAAITATFKLTDDEDVVLRQGIADEAPQMRNALAAIPTGALIECELTFRQAPHRVAYISRIDFVTADGTAEGRKIFEMPLEAATEIAIRSRQIHRLKADSENLSHVPFMDSEEWRMLKERDLRDLRARGASPLRYLKRLEASPEVMNTVDRLFNNSNSMEEFNTALRELSASLGDQAFRLESEENKVGIQTFAGESKSVPGYVDAFISMISCCKIHYLTETRAPIGESEARRILNLKTSRGQDEILRRIQTLVSDLLGVKIDAFTGSTPPQSARQDTSPAAEIDVDKFLIQVNGSGIREALRIILDYEFEQPEILLIEEPEVHLHPALEFAMLQYLKRIGDTCQVFLSTHSTNFLDTPEFENVYLVTREESTSVQLLHVEEAEDAIPHELGLRLSSLFMYDRLVFVEGSTDERMLRTLAATAGINFGKKSIGFIAMRGARNFGYYANSEVISFLSKRRVQAHFLLDRDERTTEDIERLQDLLRDCGKLWVLQRRELENYLLDTPTLVRFLEGRGIGNVSAETIDKQIDEACDNLQSIKAELRGRNPDLLGHVLNHVFRQL
ncbi:AAA family ATPase [Streptosporangium sp. NPDC048865]|uniref:ATP-dependent nuclease n=1 Tax=Streptosporangium sp. NPDC048865 TaxID=3155766 RepID=UPI00342B3F99